MNKYKTSRVYNNEKNKRKKEIKQRREETKTATKQYIQNTSANFMTYEAENCIKDENVADGLLRLEECL